MNRVNFRSRILWRDLWTCVGSEKYIYWTFFFSPKKFNVYKVWQIKFQTIQKIYLDLEKFHETISIIQNVKIKRNIVISKIVQLWLRNKHRATLINFWTFFQGLHSLLERVMHIFFSKYPLFYGMGDAYFKGYA